MATAAPSPLGPDISGFYFEKSSVQFGSLIGQGGFSQVWSVNIRTSSGESKPAAAKKVRGIEVKEVQVMKELDHPNVVTFYGIHSDGPDTYIIMELATNGDLRRYLTSWREREKCMLPVQLAKKWVYEAACGVEYLHSIQHTHRDIKSLNYLIMEDLTLKLGDLGLAKELDFTQETSGQRGTCRWMAPEVIKEQKRSMKSDVYSFGVVVWEIVTTEIPFEEMRGDFQVMNSVCSGKRPPIPDDCPQQLKELIEDAWQDDYHKRPDMGEICKMFDQGTQTEESSMEALRKQLQVTGVTEGLSIPVQAQFGDEAMDTRSQGLDTDNNKDHHEEPAHQEIFKLPVESGVSDDIIMTSASPYSSQHGMTSASPYSSQQDTSTDTGSVAMYRMCHVPRGICFIINNEDFCEARTRGHAQLFNREGSSVDSDALDAIFTKFKFKIQHACNLQTTPMYDVLDDIRRQDHSRYDAFVCCILTHGKLGELAGCGGQYLQIQEILSLFTAEKCPSLRGKPKIFFIQACQGQVSHEKHNIRHDAPPVPTGIGAALDQTIPNHADFLLGFATVPGHVSYRNTVLGSWYVSILVEKLERLHDKEDLMSILTEVNRKLSKESAKLKGGEYGQIPAPVTTLRKKLYFTTWETTEDKK